MSDGSHQLGYVVEVLDRGVLVNGQAIGGTEPGADLARALGDVVDGISQISLRRPAGSHLDVTFHWKLANDARVVRKTLPAGESLTLADVEDRGRRRSVQPSSRPSLPRSPAGGAGRDGRDEMAAQEAAQEAVQPSPATAPRRRRLRILAWAAAIGLIVVVGARLVGDRAVVAEICTDLRTDVRIEQQRCSDSGPYAAAWYVGEGGDVPAVGEIVVAGSRDVDVDVDIVSQSDDFAGVFAASD